jgi:hypothetical protein
MSTAYAPVDESLDRLHRAGWSAGDFGTATGRKGRAAP